MSRAKGQPTLSDITQENGTEGNDAPPPVVAEPAKGLARFGLNVQAVATPYWHPPDARERHDPIRILEVIYFWDGTGEKRFKNLPSGQSAHVLAVFGLERKEGGKRLWECLSSRAVAAVNDVPDPSQWFAIRGKGSGTEKTFIAFPWTEEHEREDK